MRSKGERNALLLLAAVVVLGAATRVWRSSARAALPHEDDRALTRQIADVDTIRARGRMGRGRRGSALATATHPLPTEGAPAPTIPWQPPLPPMHPAPVDIDWATSVALMQLPGIGPAIAARIIADRDAGPFGCMAALRTVKGVGPALARRLDSLVKFSGPSRRDLGLCP